MTEPKREQSWTIAGWQIVQWAATEDSSEFATGDSWFTAAKDHLEPDAYGHDCFASIHEAMVAVVAHTYQPDDGIDAQGQAFTFLRAIGAHVYDREHSEWKLVPPPGRP